MAKVAVAPIDDGGWEVRDLGNEQRASKHVRKRDAEASARNYLRRVGGGEVVIHRKSGQVEVTQTVGPNGNGNANGHRSSGDDDE